MESRTELSYQRALVEFLSRALDSKRERIVGFAASQRKKTQRKLFPLIYHELETLIDPKSIVNSFPERVWSSPAYLFCSPRDLGTPVASLEEGLESRSGDSERLVITQDGRYGCLRTEMSGDFLVSVRNP